MGKMDINLKKDDKILASIVSSERYPNDFVVGVVRGINEFGQITINWVASTYWSDMPYNSTPSCSYFYEYDYEWIKSIEKIDDTAFEALINFI